MLKAIQRFLFVVLLMAGGLYLLAQGFLYLRARNLMPPGMGIAGVDVSGLTRDAAAELVTSRYLAPIFVFHQEERVPINPEDVGFVIDIEGMMQMSDEVRVQQEPWQDFVTFLLQRPFTSTQIPLRASHDAVALQEQLEMIANILDQPARAPQFTAVSAAGYEEGEAGFVTDIEASLPELEQALYQSDNRDAQLVINEEVAPDFNIGLLKENIERQLQSFDGIGSVFVMDLETGEEININADQAISGLSILKIGIFLETYRVLNGTPDQYVQELLFETAVHSSNFDANLLLHVIAGENNTYRGADLLTESFQKLGLVNTFMMIPYDASYVANRPTTTITPANTRPDLLTIPDPARQTTAEDMGIMLAMIYRCSKGGGALLAIYPGELTPQDCQAIIDLMVQNTEGNLIRFGVPEDVPVSHKHGWGDGITHGDAGIVLSPGGDYVLVYYLHQPQTDFLVSEYSFPYLWDISYAVYNYFNIDNPNLEDPQARAEREATARAAAAEEEAAAEEAAAQEAATQEAEPSEEAP